MKWQVSRMDRKEALEKLLIMQCKYRHIRKKDDEWEAIETAIQALQEPERKKGHWTTELKADTDSLLRCSVCGYPVSYFGGRTDFCPNCGADMRKGEEE